MREDAESLGGSASLSVSRVLVQHGSDSGANMVGGGGGCAVHLRMPNTWRIGKDHILSAVFAGSCRGFGVETRGLAKKRRGVFAVVPAKKMASRSPTRHEMTSPAGDKGMLKT